MMEVVLTSFAEDRNYRTFQMNVGTLRELEHENLVKVLGICSEIRASVTEVRVVFYANSKNATDTNAYKQTLVC